MQHIIDQLMANALGIIEHDTLPGIVGRMTPENARAMNAVKHRMPNKGFIVLIPSTDWVAKLATNVSHQARQLMAQYWPGPLTIILNKTRGAPCHHRWANHHCHSLSKPCIVKPIAPTIGMNHCYPPVPTSVLKLGYRLSY